MRIKDRRLSFPQSRAADIVRRTAAHRARKQGAAKNDCCREAHLQHQKENRRDKRQDDYTDSQTKRIYTQRILTNVSVSEPSSRSTIWHVTPAKEEAILRNARTYLISHIDRISHYPSLYSPTCSQLYAIFLSASTLASFPCSKDGVSLEKDYCISTRNRLSP